MIRKICDGVDLDIVGKVGKHRKQNEANDMPCEMRRDGIVHTLYQELCTEAKTTKENYYHNSDIELKTKAGIEVVARGIAHIPQMSVTIISEIYPN